MTRSEQELVRIDKLKELTENNFKFPNNSKPDSFSKDLLEIDCEEVDQSKIYTIAGRIVQQRIMGKAAFVHILDDKGKIQSYVRKSDVGDESYADFKKFDIGDIVEIKGYLFTTKMGEKTIHATSIRLLTKSLIPLPEKWHGLSDIESRYRYRYVDLIANPEVRNQFKTRAKIISYIRKFLDKKDYTEVETPVLNYVPGGASARPFGTHYNALDCDMFLRIALELPLKKLIVGGLDRVYEIGRVFRNEGVSKKHNPEFTMIEFYQAYADYKDLMELTEELLSALAKEITGDVKFKFNDKELDFSAPFKKISMLDSLSEIGGLDKNLDFNSLDVLVGIAKENKIELKDPSDWGYTLQDLFEELVEHKLWEPVFITEHPFSTSPLARKNDENPNVTDRFELIIAGMEVANAFSELNDPIDQRERFESQAKRRAEGDEEAPEVEEDFLRALEYGMPPTAGEGIGIDRLVMLLTSADTIRDVLLFPQLKPLNQDKE